MSTEELTRERTGDSLQFDAHEFDGLREAIEKEAEGILAKVDEYVRENPWVCIGLAVGAGIAIGCLTRRSAPRKAAEQSS